MFGKKNLLNLCAITLFIIVFSILSACSQVQNLVISPQSSKNSCVQPSMYCPNGTSGCSKEALAINNFPFIAKNPVKAPYCMSFTIKNNNSPSQGGSNMQITYPGLVITGFPNESATSFSLMDPISSEESDVITNQTQTIGNVALFDPNNCATIGGANSVTIQGGQSCTFYIQIVSEAYAPNTYPLSLQYSAYNGNINYTIVTNIYEHVVLYGGTESGLYQNISSGTLPAQWANNTINAPRGKTGSIITDVYGNLYFANASQVYIYNGFNLSTLGSEFTTAINSLTFDLNGNLYAGTNGSGLYVYNTANSTWENFSDTSGYLNNASIISGLSSTGFLPNSGSQYLYVTTINKAYKCLIAPNSSVVTSCAFTDISLASGAPSSFNTNALDSDNYGLYLGSDSNTYNYIESQNVWKQYNFTGAPITSNVVSVFHQTVGNTTHTYVGMNNGMNVSESAIYNCNAAFDCNVVIQPSNPSNNITVSGNVDAITADGDGDLFIGGNSLNSQAFTSTPNVAGAYLIFGSSTSIVWQAIANGTLPAKASINSMAISSTLSGQ